jgi:transcriptional repressor NrdR
MKCPFCHEGKFEVIDTRNPDGNFPVRRRRLCSACKRRAFTVEHLEETPLKVVKKNGNREPFDRDKLRRGLALACYKRPVSDDQIDRVIRRVEDEIYSRYWGGEVAAAVVGDLVMEYLKDLDQVAYVRFASVYREFKDVSDFVQEVKPMLPAGKRRKRSR